MAALLRLRLGRLVGLALLLLALLRYRSEERRPVLDRWSYPHAALIVCAAGLGLAALRGSWRARRRHDDPSASGAAAAACADVAALTWGLAYWWSALEAGRSAGRISDLNFFGSVTPGAVPLEWVSLVALSLAAGIVLFPRRGRWLNPALAAAALWTLLLLGEGLARARALLAPATEGFPTYSGALWVRGHVRLNLMGFRDAEHRPGRAPGTRRLLVIGDSFAYGVGIPRTEDRFGEQLGGELARATGVHWEVINGSRPDSHTLQEIGMLDSALQFHPDVVVLLYVFNDIDYLHPVTERSVLTAAPRTAWERLHPVRVLFKNSHLFQQAYVRYRLLRRDRPAADQPYADSAAVWSHLADLARFVAVARRAGAVVGIAPFDNTVGQEPTSRRRYADFVRWAAAFGLPVWPIDRVFDDVPLSRLTVNALDHHPNELANRLAAKAVTPWVLETLHTGRARSQRSPTE